MRFGLVHRVMTDALAVLGILAVVSTAALSPWATVALLAGLAFALAVPEAWQSRALFRHAATTGMLLLFIVQFTRIILGNPVIDVMVEFAALLQIIRLATRRGAAHDQQIIVLSLLHFVAGTVLGGGIAYGLCFLGFLIVAPGALVLSHLRREVEGNYRQGARDRTGLPVDVPRILRSRRVVGRGFLASTCLISVPIFVFTALLFVLFPRVGLSLLLLNHPHPGRMVGFTDHVKIDEVGLIRSNPQMALRFELDNMPSPSPPRMILRLRGTAFDKSDGVNWTRTMTSHPELSHNGDSYRLKDRQRQPGDKKITFDVEPIDPPVIFLPPRAVGVQLKPQSQTLMNDALTLQSGPEGEFRYAGGDTRGIRYEVTMAPEGEDLGEVLAPVDRARYLELPSLPMRIADLAHKWADGQPSQWQKAHAIEDHLRHDFHYDLNSPSGGATVPLDDFLFVSKRGHCEFFSTAMALMLRDVGIPSRNVTGFVGGTYNRFGHYYAVREGEAHSWVEAYIDDVPNRPTGNWTTFDPTPSAGAQPLGDTTGAWVYVRDLVEAVSQRWNHYVVGYDLRSQVHLYDWFRGERSFGKHGSRRIIYAGSAIVLGILAYVLWRRRKRGGPTPAQDKKNERGQQVAASMYRVLEQALLAQGLTRPPSLPPLRFAEELKGRAHPLGTEVIDLTEIYLSVRFGGTKLDDDALRGFDRRVRAVRVWKRSTAA